jgi:hypothetical protein
MRAANTIIAVTFVLAVASICLVNSLAQTSLAARQTEQASAMISEKTATQRPRPNAVRAVDFYLRTGEFIVGKLVSDDRNKVIVERVSESKIVLSTYSKREIEPRTMQTRSTPEYKYYLDLADYFSGRTWDFKDDPDDFIQAIRCCETAKRSIQGTQADDNDRVEQIDQKIEKLRADRQVWEKEVQSRAKLKELEFKAEFDKRFNELEQKVNASTQKIDESVDRLDKIITDMQDNHQRIEQNFSLMDQDIRRQLSILADQIEATRRLIDPLRWRPRYYYYP